MRKFNTCSIKVKLISIIMGITFTALLITNILQMAIDYINLRSDLTNELNQEAELSGRNLASALDFLDSRTAQEILDTFSHKDAIQLACLYDVDGELFSSYHTSHDACPDTKTGLANDIHHGFGILKSSYVIHSNGAPIGMVHLEHNMSGNHAEFVKKELIALGLILLSSFLAYLVANYVQRLISKPIVELAKNADKISHDKDYSTRIKQTTDDETGVLVAAFNNMVETIQANERTLIKNNETLELIVEERTEDLRDKENHLRAVLNTVVDGIVVIDMQGTIHTFNPGAEKIFGYQAKEVVGRNVKILMPEQIAKEHDSYLQNYMTTGDAKIIGIGRELDAIRKDGSIFSAELGINEMDVVGARMFVGTLRDITERKEAETELKKHRDHLQEIVDKKTEGLKVALVEMEAAKKIADDANQMKGEFLANMSHEIRTPMNGIMGMTELMLETKLTNQQHNYARTVINSADALLNIINDILDFSKIESGKLELEPISFDLMTIVEDAAEILAVKAREKAIELIVRYVPGTEQHLVGDPGRIRQIITNLTGNAIKFTEMGYVSISVEAVNTKDTPKNKQLIKISIADTGIGIPKEAQGKIFEKFSQADASTTRKFGGTGLGLAISQELSYLMGGDIGVESTPREGSTFWFTMLLDEDISDHETLPHPDNLKGLRFLIVDDITLNGNLLNECFEPLGVECVIEEHSSKAVSILQDAIKKDKHFDLVIIDYLMPHINGDILAKRIKTTKGLENITLIMLTSSGGAGYTRFFKEAGFSGYLTKPVKTSELIELTSLVWDHHSKGKKDSFVTVDDLISKRSASLEYRDVCFKSPSILLAEDNRVNQGLAVEMLESAGCKVDVATNGKQAINCLKENDFDLIFMDCEMPEMDGFEASQIITAYYREKGITGTPIVALTGNAMKGDRDRCLAAGMSDYLTKPIRKNQFLRMVAKWLPDFIDKDMLEGKVRFNNYKLLLVEDNRINAAMAEEMLVEMGLDVVVAKDGKQGVEAAQQTDFDMIFMDWMMPVMDGLEATTEIRKLEEKGEIKHCPIVALTANAMEGDREKCLKSGMDNYFTKPLKKDLMQDMLAKYLTPTMIAQSDKSEIPVDGFDQQLFYSYKRIMGNKFDKSIGYFFEDSKIMLSKLKEAHEKQDLQELSTIAHTLKSTSAAIGAVEFSDIALSLEKEARKRITNGQSDTPLPNHIIERLKTSFNEIEQKIEKLGLCCRND